MMKTATVKNLSIQMDVIEGNKEEIMQALELINLTLQREPYSLCAQIMGPWNVCDDDIEIEEAEEV